MNAGEVLQSIVRGKQETCEACQNSFTCGPFWNCWCAKEKLPRETLGKLKQTYRRCLCPECLRNARTPEASG